MPFRFEHSTRVALLALIVSAGWVALAEGQASRRAIAARDDAYVEAVGSGDGWVVGNTAMAFHVGFDAEGRLVARDLRSSASDRSWRPAGAPESSFRLDGRDVTLARSDARGLRLGQVVSGETATGVELRLVFESPRDGLRISRIYAVSPGVAAVETWTELEATGGEPVPVSDLVSFRLAAQGELVTWVSGLEATAESGGSFAIQERRLGEGDAIHLEATGRSTQYALPMFAARGDEGTLFAAYLWSGSWTLDLTGTGSGRFETALGLGSTSTLVVPGRTIELPHAVFGVVEGDEADVAPALHRFIVTTLRQGRALEPLVTYNTWFVTGTRVDALGVSRQMTAAAAAGAELFELDAGWYEGAGELDAFDFASGLGSWLVDREKFPDGLRPLGDLARSLGMKFGLWVEPERVDLRNVGRAGMIQEAWLAQQDGLYQPGVPNGEARIAQLDFGHPDARAWMVERLSAVIAEHGVDYLKWDSNAWIENTRPREGRGARDGNFAHVRGLYQVLAELKARFPHLLIENCAGGGNRLDLGLLRYTDAGWMDDRTSPSAHVRHNLEGLSTFLPPAYLLSYLISHADEPMHGAPDMLLYSRSRMPGVLGLSFPVGELDERDARAVAEETAVWKSFRDLQRRASLVRLTAQVAGPASPAWDAMALVSLERDEAIVFAFQNERAAERATIRLRRLDPDSTYAVRSLRLGDLGRRTGAELMGAGIELFAGEDTAARIIRLTRVNADPPPPN
jgi:alpha-galactosidase